MRCEGCKINFPDDVALQSLPRSFRSTRRTLCPRCIENGKHAVDRWGFLCALAYLPAAYFAPHEAQPAVANIGLLFVAMFTAVIPHEIGHALAAWCLRFRVFRIIFGRGRPYVRFALPWVRTLVDVRPLMTQGLVMAAPLSTRWCRTRQTIYILAGPAANLLLVLIASQFIHWNDLRREMFVRVSPWLAICAGNVLVVIGALWPRRNPIPQALGSDGFQLQLVSRSRPVAERDVRLTLAQMSIQCAILRGEYAQAAREADATIAEFGPHPALLTAALSANISLHHLDTAEQLVFRSLEIPNLPFKAQAEISFAHAWIEILRDTEKSFAHARLHADAGRTFLPFSDTLLMIDGAIDVLAGDLEAGTRALRFGLRRIDEENMRASLYAMLALAAARVGDARGSGRLMKRARRCDANCETFTLVERKIASLQGTQTCPATTISTPKTMNTTPTMIVR